MTLEEYQNQKDPKPIMWWVKLREDEVNIKYEDETNLMIEVKSYPEFRYRVYKDVWNMLWSTRKWANPKPTCFILDFKI